MERRTFLNSLVLAGILPRTYFSAIRGLPELRIEKVRVITTSGGSNYRWVFVKILTSEPGLYGIGSASNLLQPFSVATAIEKHFAPFWVGKNADRIEDLWQIGNVRSYWRNSTILNNALSALDMALWDIKAKRAGMPLYEILGGKVRDAVPLYAHADGRDAAELIDAIRGYVEQGYRHVRGQLGGYGGGGMIPPGVGSRPIDGYNETAFDEGKYLEAIPRVFEQLRVKLGTEVELLHDVHEHLSPSAAVQLAKRLEPYRLFFVEDILPPEQIAWFRQIRQVTSTPMAMGELFTSQQEWLPLISERLIDFIRCRISQVGGISVARKIATVCESFGVRTAWQEGGDNDPVNQLASYHVDLVSSSFGIQEENHFPALAQEMLPGTAEIKGGYLYGSHRPGLGIDLDEQLAQKHPLQSSLKEEDWTTVRSLDGSKVNP